MMRFTGSIVWITAVWLVFWRDLSWANLASGVLVALAITLGGVATSRRPDLRLHPVALGRFLAVFAWSVVKANFVVAWEVVTPGSRINEGIVTVELPTHDPIVITIVSHAIGLAPGTMVIDIEREPTVLFVHVLHLRTVEAVRADVLRLERLARSAVASAADVPDTRPVPDPEATP